MAFGALGLALANLIDGQVPGAQPSSGVQLVVGPTNLHPQLVLWAKSAFNAPSTQVVALAQSEKLFDAVKKAARSSGGRIGTLWLFAHPGNCTLDGAIGVGEDAQRIHFIQPDIATRIAGGKVDRIEMATHAACTPSFLATMLEKWGASEIAAWNMQRRIHVVELNFNGQLSSEQQAQDMARKLSQSIFRNFLSNSAGMSVYVKDFLVPGMPRSTDELARRIHRKTKFDLVYESFAFPQADDFAAPFDPGIGIPPRQTSVKGLPASSARPEVVLSIAEARETDPATGKPKHDGLYCTVEGRATLQRIVVRK